MAEVVAQLEKQLESERKELAYARLKIQVLEEQLRQQKNNDFVFDSLLPLDIRQNDA
jgi:hypothetical protein